ncbi:MAG: hypothetical protein KBS74_07325 [Clostridiales bacterium]|nr:hypothetical protein [Candidatus Cacconaster stercorequi]
MQKSTKELALCSMLGALGVVFLGLGGLIPFAVYACPILASLVLIPARETCRRSYAWCCFAAIALLGLILGPDKEAALLFCFLGYYPLVKPQLDHLHPKSVQWLCKLALAAVAIAVVYFLLLYVFCVPAVVDELAATARWMLIAMVVLGLVLFVVYDVMLYRLTSLYQRRRRKR